MAVTNASATAYSSQKLLLALSTGRLVSVYSDTGTNAKFKYSDDGQTWTDYAQDVAGWANGSIAAYVDSGGTERIVAVWKQSGTGGGRTDTDNYMMVGAFNAGRTTITWSAALSMAGAGVYGYPDVVVKTEGTGARALAVLSYANGTAIQTAYYVGTISNTGVPSLSVGLSLLGGNYTSTVSGTFPSIDINPSDGRAHAAWSAGTTGAGKGIRYRTASYSAGVWTWATEVEVDNTRYINTTARYVNCRWDGTRAVIGGSLWSGANDLMQYESTNFTTFTTRTLIATVATAAAVHYGGMGVDASTGDTYFLGIDGNLFGVQYYKWTRASTTLGSVVVTDAGVGGGSGTANLNATYSGSTLRWIYTSGNNSPFSVKYDQLVLGTPSTLQMLV